MADMSTILRNMAKAVSLAVSPLTLKRNVPVILMYHSVIGNAELELDVRPQDFRAHVSWLAANAHVVSLERVCELWSSGVSKDADGKPYVALTFDDAYEDFFHLAWPLLREHCMPVTLYVPTLFIDAPECIPLSRLEGNYQELKPMTWGMLREVSTCSFVTLAAHSHGHIEYTSLDDQEIEEDIQRSLVRFQEELGFLPVHFAYPRGAWNARAEAIVSKHFESAALVGFDGEARSGVNRFRIGRIPVLRSDKVFWFSHRVLQKLEFEEYVARAFRGWRRRSHSRSYS